MTVTLILFVFYAIPESIIMILAALTLLGQRFKVRRLLLAGLGLSMVAFLARTYLLHLGLHTPVILLGLITALMLGFRLSLNLAVTGCFLSYFLLMLGDSQIALPILRHLGVSFKETLEHAWWGVGFGWISASFLIFTIVICRLTGFVLVRSTPNPDIKIVNSK